MLNGQGLYLSYWSVVIYRRTNKYNEKLVTLLSIWIKVIKSKETRVFTYTCRYSSGHIIPIIQSTQSELMPTRISVGDHPCFLTFYNHDPC